MSDPKNKWTRPGAPPAPMFFGEKERNLIKQVNDELAERVLGQSIAYYPISIEESNFNDIYGEAKEKISLPPVRVFAYVEVQNDQTNTKYGYEYQTKLTVNFHRRRLVEDQNLFVRVGDFIQYGDVFYEIVKTYNDTRYYFGQVEHKFQISAECVRARTGMFRVMPGIDRPTDEVEAADNPASPAPRSAPYPPLAASYITVNSEIQLPNERRLAAGAGITFTDGGPNGDLTIASSGQNAIGPTGSIQINAGAGVFHGDSSLLFNTSSNTLTLTGRLTSSVHISSSILNSTYLTSSFLRVLPTSGTAGGAGSYLALDANNNVIVTSSTGGSGIPGGANTQVQFNNNGSFEGSANLTFASDVLNVSGGMVHRRTAAAGSFVASSDHYIIGVTSVPTEIELNATSFADGQVLLVKDESGNASSANSITLSASATQTIDGFGEVEIESPFGAVHLYTNGINWFIY